MGSAVFSHAKAAGRRRTRIARCKNSWFALPADPRTPPRLPGLLAKRNEFSLVLSGLLSDPSDSLARRQTKAFGSVFGFILPGRELGGAVP